MDKNNKNSIGNSLLTPREVAQQLGVSPVTVRHWALDGKLEFISTPGGHRRFLQEQVDQFVQAHGVNKANNSTPKMCVLIVENDAGLSSYLNDFIETMGAPIDSAVANDGFEAGELVHEFNPDLVLLDLMMPNTNGYELCEKLRKLSAFRTTPILILTGNDGIVDRVRAKMVGSSDFLSKARVDTKTVLGAIRKHLRHCTLTKIVKEAA